MRDVAHVTDIETLQPSRRALIKGGAVAAGVAALGAGPLRFFDAASASAPAKKGVFGYGVASGDPTADAVVIWTRATPPAKKGQPVATPGSGLGRPLQVEWELAADPGFKHVVKRGHVKTNAASDHTVKVDVTGLDPYTRYWYRFSAEGETSPIGRTQTAGDEPHRTHALRFALISCSNFASGYFTAYRAIGKRDDLDFVLHVGDYIYEYGDGQYGDVRDLSPATETIDLEGYRLRHAQHKADADLQLAHARHPFITIFDDHEVANNAWSNGAENHTPATEGAYLSRRAQAYQAYLEWMPFRVPSQSVPHQGTRFFRRFTFGPLGDLSVLETRQNRSEQVMDTLGAGLTTGGFISVAQDAVKAALADPSRHLPEPQQMDWLLDGVAAKSKPWHLLGNQVIMAPILWPTAAFGIPEPYLSAWGPVLVNSDQWDGYKVDQAKALEAFAAQPPAAGDVVVLTGDIHSSWAIDLVGPQSGKKAGVEFVCPSITSDGIYELALGQVRKAAPAGTPDAYLADTAVAAVVGTPTSIGAVQAIQGVNTHVKYLDGIGHGFTVVDVTPDRVQADYFHTPTPSAALPDPRTDATVEPGYKSSWQTLAGSRQLSAASGPIGERSDHPRHLHEHRHAPAPFPGHDKGHDNNGHGKGHDSKGHAPAHH